MIISVAAGVVVGMLIGALGGGGGVLTIPILVFGLDVAPHVAASSSLVIVGVTSALALVGAARRRVVHWGTGLVFGVIGTVGTFFGTALARRIDGAHLLLAFAALLVVIAIVMWRRAALAPDSHQTSVAPRDRPVMGSLLGPEAATIMAAATAVGLLTGFFGVGGGFAVVPALVLALKLPMSEAVGTSLLVLTLNTCSALAARAITEHGLPIDVGIVVPFTCAAIGGSYLGAALARRAPSDVLQRAFAVLLVGVALLTAVRTLA